MDYQICLVRWRDTLTTKVSIIVPFFNKWELTHQRLMEFSKYLPDFCEICLVNDDSTDEGIDGGVAFWQQGASRLSVKYRRNKENLGFGGSHNAGAKIASGDILVFHSNDVIVMGDYVSPLVEMIEKNENPDKVLAGGKIIYWPAGWNEFEVEGNKSVIPYVEGWLVACTRTAWDELGGWDTRYGKFDYEDVDLSTKALSLGYNLVSMETSLHFPLVRHIGGATIGSLKNVNRLDQTTHNRQVFIDKWSEFLKTL